MDGQFGVPGGKRQRKLGGTDADSCPEDLVAAAEIEARAADVAGARLAFAVEGKRVAVSRSVLLQQDRACRPRASARRWKCGWFRPVSARRRMDARPRFLRRPATAP